MSLRVSPFSSVWDRILGHRTRCIGAGRRHCTHSVAFSVILDTHRTVAVDLLDVAYRQHELRKVSFLDVLVAVADCR